MLSVEDTVHIHVALNILVFPPLAVMVEGARRAGRGRGDATTPLSPGTISLIAVSMSPSEEAYPFHSGGGRGLS